MSGLLADTFRDLRLVDNSDAHPANPSIEVRRDEVGILAWTASGRLIGKVAVRENGYEGSLRTSEGPLFLPHREDPVEALVCVFDEMWRDYGIAYTRKPWPKFEAEAVTGSAGWTEARVAPVVEQSPLGQTVTCWLDGKQVSQAEYTAWHIEQGKLQPPPIVIPVANLPVAEVGEQAVGPANEVSLSTARGLFGLFLAAEAQNDVDRAAREADEQQQAVDHE